MTGDMTARAILDHRHQEHDHIVRGHACGCAQVICHTCRLSDGWISPACVHPVDHPGLCVYEART